MKMFVPLLKTDAETRMVYGYASTYDTDDSGETIEKAALSAALPSYMQFANIREMHQPKAVGVATEAELDEKGLYIAAKIVDNDAWEKCVQGVYKGFSVGGRVTSRDPANKKLIKGVMMTEISLADRPVNPECVFDMVKAHATQEQIAAARKAVDVATTLFKNTLTVNASEEVLNDSIFKTALHILPTCSPEGVVVPEGVLAKVIAGEFKDAEVAAQAVDAGAPAAAAAGSEAKAEATPAAAVDNVAKAADGVAVVQPTGEAKVAAVVDQNAGGVAIVDKLQKGMYDVRTFADLLSQLVWLAQSMSFESEAEGDESPLPPEMWDWVKQGAALFTKHAAEEARELVGDTVDKAVTGGDLRKVWENIVGNDVLRKAGARHSKADAQRLQGIHDHSVSMGATCGSMSKAAPTDDLQKAVIERDDKLQKAHVQITELTTANADLLKKNTELEGKVKTLSELPAAPKGQTRQPPVAKDADGTLAKATDTETSEEPAEESVLDLIKKSHQQPRFTKLA